MIEAPAVTKGNVTQHNHLGAITTKWAKCASPSVQGTHRKTRMKGKTLRLPPHGAAAKNPPPGHPCSVAVARNALAVVTAQSHSRANGIARAAYACSGAVHCTWQPAILISRLLAAGLRYFRLRYLG